MEFEHSDGAVNRSGVVDDEHLALDIIDKVEINRNYRKSDTLQLLRILKNYDLLKDPQLDLLTDRPSPAVRRRPAAES